MILVINNNDFMNIAINEIKNNLTIINKDDNTFAKGNEIIDINIHNNDNKNKFFSLINVICNLLNLNDNEKILFTYVIKDCIDNEYNMRYNYIINFNKEYIYNACRKLLISESTIRRTLAMLISKNVFQHYNNSVNKLIINPKYDIIKYFDKPIEYITIKL